MSVEFELKGQTYRAEKLDAMQQFQVSRKIAPLVPRLIPVFVRLAKGGKQSLTDDAEGLSELLMPMAEGLAGMPDDTAEYVVSACMSVVRRQQGATWSPVWNAPSKTVMFQDIELDTMLPMVVRVIMDSLGNFITGLLASQTSDPSQKATEAPGG